MQIKVQGTKPNTSLERKTKNLCSHIEMQLDIQGGPEKTGRLRSICNNSLSVSVATSIFCMLNLQPICKCSSNYLVIWIKIDDLRAF